MRVLGKQAHYKFLDDDDDDDDDEYDMLTYIIVIADESVAYDSDETFRQRCTEHVLVGVKRVA